MRKPNEALIASARELRRTMTIAEVAEKLGAKERWVKKHCQGIRREDERKLTTLVMAALSDEAEKTSAQIAAEIQGASSKSIASLMNFLERKGRVERCATTIDLRGRTGAPIWRILDPDAPPRVRLALLSEAPSPQPTPPPQFTPRVEPLRHASFTAEFFGDPLPGRSALDARFAAQSQGAQR